MISKKIAVLLAAFNGGKYLSDQIDAILDQELDNACVDIFISLDLSVDNSFDICREYASQYENITFLSYGEHFGGAGKNFFRLIKDTDLSEYDYIAFSDQDDLWLNNKLAKAVAVLKSESFECYSSNVTAFWEDGRELLIDKAQAQCDWDFIFEAAGPGCTYVLKRNIFIEFKAWLLERYDDIRYEIDLHDWLLYAFARARGYSWFIDPNPMMRYRQHISNQVGTNNSFSAAKKRLQLIENKWYRKQSTSIAVYLELQELPFFKFGLNNGYAGNLYLLCNVNKLRRRLRDRFAFSFVLLFNLF